MQLVAAFVDNILDTSFEGYQTTQSIHSGTIQQVMLRLTVKTDIALRHRHIVSNLKRARTGPHL